MLQVGGQAGAKAQGLENPRCFSQPAKEGVWRAMEEGRSGSRVPAAGKEVDLVRFASSPGSDLIRRVLPCLRERFRF